MPTNTYTALATITLTGTDASIDFASIPGTYRDLVLVADCATTGTTDIGIQVNADTGTNYSYVLMRGYPTTTVESSANTYDRFYWSHSSVVSSGRFMGTANFMDYSATDKHKSVLNRSNYDGSLGKFVEAKGSRWASNTAISSIKVFTSSNAFAIGSTFSLYGIAS